VSARNITVDVEFDMPTSGSIAEYREALEELERLIPREHQDDVVISWSGESSWDVSYATCSVYYEKEETPEEVAARIAKNAEIEATRKQSMIEYFSAQLARLES